jgi:methyltransferase
MNVLLIYPPNPDYCVLNEDFSCCEPLGLEYIAASLLEQHNVRLMDMRFEDDLESELARNQYDIIGIAVPFTTAINTCNRLLRHISRLTPNAVRILGGHYPSTSLAGLHLDQVDFVITGEGVHSITELVNALETGGDIYAISGIAIVREGIACFTDQRDFAHLDTCPLPARQLLAPYHHRYFHAHYKPITLMRFSVGCPFDCSFCILWKMTNRKYFTRSKESIVEELRHIDNQNIYVVDDEAFINAKRMEELADLIRQEKINKHFHMYVRSDTIVNNPALFEKWAAAGLDSVLVGLESIFTDDLEGYRKKITYDMARKCIGILHSNNIEIRANFIVKPDYTLERFRQIREAVVELNIDRPTFAVLTPFIGTDEYTQVKDELILDNPEFYDCYHTLLKTRLPIKTFYREFANLFRSAQQRDSSQDNKKIFYSGNGNTFESFVSKIENSYLSYPSACHAGLQTEEEVMNILK